MDRIKKSWNIKLFKIYPRKMFSELSTYRMRVLYMPMFAFQLCMANKIMYDSLPVVRLP